MTIDRAAAYRRNDPICADCGAQLQEAYDPVAGQRVLRCPWVGKGHRRVQKHGGIGAGLKQIACNWEKGAVHKSYTTSSSGPNASSRLGR